MKIKVLFPVFCLAMLIAVPPAEAQSKRVERKLKKEMRKLEKQMKKVHELKGDIEYPSFKEIEVLSQKELKKLDELKDFRWEMDEKTRIEFQKQAEKAREQAEKYREQHREQYQQYREQAREYQLKAREEWHKQMEQNKHHWQELRERYPDGIHIDEIEIPEFDIEIPEIDFELPEMNFEHFYKVPEARFYREFDGKFPKGYNNFEFYSDSDNNLSVNTDLEEESIDKTYNFTVADDATILSLRAKGSVSEGTIEIEILDPKKGEFQSIELSPAADVDWSQKVKITEEKKEKLAGKWTIRVKGDDVSGHFGLSLRSR